MISKKSIEEVFQTMQIEDIVQDFVTLRRRGTNLQGLCPFHNEKTPSFNVSPSKNIFKCFGCGEGGNAIHFLMEHENMSYPDAIRYIAKKYGIELEETQQSQEYEIEKQRQESFYLINEFAQQYYEEQLFETDKGKSIGLSYFRRRGFSEETIRKFGLGYAPPGKDQFTLRAVQQGYDQALLRELGLTTQYGRDFFRDRVMFTIRNISGKVIAFAGRIMQKDAKAPKYINSPETEIYHKSKVLYGIHLARTPIRRQDQCILTEGYTDVISLHQHGVENVVASSGTSLTEGQIGLIKRYTNHLTILYDGDAAGAKAALRGLDLVLAQDMNVKVAILPEGEDPDSYVQKVGGEAFQAFIREQAQDFILRKADVLVSETQRDPVQRTERLKDLMHSISRIPDSLKRAAYIRECARITDTDEQLFITEINKVLGQDLRKSIARQEKAEQQKQHPSDSLSDTPKSGTAANTNSTTAHGFQERDVIRILIQYGDQMYDEEASIKVAEYLIGSVEDILADFDVELYQHILKECEQRLSFGEPIHPEYFVNNQDARIQKLAVDFLSSNYEYSENWEKRHEVFLLQNKPEENFRIEAKLAVKRVRLKKIRRRMEEVRQRMSADLGQDDTMAYMRLYQKLKGMHDDIARSLGTVIS